MARKAVEPENFVYIVLEYSEKEGSFKYSEDFSMLKEAKNHAKQTERRTKILRARKATVLRFLKRM